MSAQGVADGLGGAHRAHRAHRGARRQRKPRSLYYRRIRALVLLVLAVLLLLVGISLGSALLNPVNGSSIGARFAEWAREHGGASIVRWGEKEWYTHHQPPVGGRPAKGALVVPGSTTSTTPTTAPVPQLPAPAAMQPVASPALAGEGQWTPTGRLVDGVPAVYETRLRPDAQHTSEVVGVAWMDTKLLRATLYSGSQIPGGGPFAHTAPVQPTAATSLVAAFNAGFLMTTAQGGYYTDGRVVDPLRTGAASVVIYKDGTVTVGQWGTDVTMTPDVVSVRQNLDLLVQNGAPVPGLDATTTTRWGNTLGNQVYVYRSALGVTADGALVYVGGPSLNITDLANLLVDAGAVRGMELDINTDWVNFSSYAPSTPSGAATGTDGTELVPTMVGTSARYFQSWWARDFFTMSAR
ncbi:MAG: phosphodiester glycosidase family protein [Acidimicrobiales bacterium]